MPRSARRSTPTSRAVNEAGGINGRKIKFISLDDGYSPPKTVEMVRQLVEQDKIFALFQPLGTPCNTAIHKYMNQQEGAAALRRHRRLEVGRSEELPVDHGLPARLPHRGGDLRQAHPGQRQGRQDRRAAPERRLRPRLSRRLQGRAGQGGGPHRQDRDLRGDRSDGRQPDHPAQGFRRQRLLQRLGAQGRGAGHPQGGRHRLEAGALPQQRLGLGRRGHEARGLRQRPGHHHGGLHHGRHRQGLGRQRRDEGLARLDGQEHAAAPTRPTPTTSTATPSPR